MSPYYTSEDKKISVLPTTDIEQFAKDFEQLSLFKKETTHTKQSSFPVILKLYDEQVKLNDLVEVIGILHVNKPKASTDGHIDVDDPQFLTFTTRYPKHIVPRLHCLSMKRVTLNEIMHERLTLAPTLKTKAPSTKALRSFFNTVALGNPLLSMYIGASLISSPTIRSGGIVSGQILINIKNAKQTLTLAGKTFTYAEYLARALERVSPISSCHEFNVKSMNRDQMRIVQNLKMNTIDPGTMPTLAQSLLILDETSVQPGKLGPNGMKNYQFVKTLVTQ